MFRILGQKPKSANVAKDRLQILLAHERAGRGRPDFLPALQQELLDVIRRYVQVDDDDVAVRFEALDDKSIIEVNVEFAPNQ